MSFRKIVLGLLTFCIGLMGLAFGALFVICLSLYVLWHGLSVSIIVFGVLSLFCIIFARWFLRGASASDKQGLSGRDPELIQEEHSEPFAFSSSFREERNRQRRHKML